ncbi:MAG TPA: 2-oxo acid dehydrogenase subunit E2 [Alphaproteobacteria bacterium]|jgi:pyruvate dehydrogenase E2 component (dihydrolipoamide acetyltransferase)|nr:2-oxo acid dehydrogenase subunit E2 [Alphaproteobacteria bacterium]MDP6270527.1 2-oxo acid dehydrogenase subunit E2 [Alphaproteobacteria bacterium]HJM50815.1 2-oxo acid dehydrogenase subunit E2 [Alphaproteobacteria bacterium]
MTEAVHEPDTGPFGVTIAEVVALGPMQRMAAQHLSKSHIETAPVTLLGEAEVDGLVALRKTLNAGREDAAEPRISYTHLILKILALALGRHRRLNSALVEKELHVFADINIGMALSLPDGNLIVPVIRHVDRKSLDEVAAEASELAARGAAGKLGLDDVRGATFTLTNAGMVPSARWTTPIIPLPQAAILGVGAVREAAVVRAGEVVAGHVLPLSLTFDHRLVNGVPASEFLDDLGKLLAEPPTSELSV